MRVACGNNEIRTKNNKYQHNNVQFRLQHTNERSKARNPTQRKPQEKTNNASEN